MGTGACMEVAAHSHGVQSLGSPLQGEALPGPLMLKAGWVRSCFLSCLGAMGSLLRRYFHIVLPQVQMIIPGPHPALASGRSCPGLFPSDRQLPGLRWEQPCSLPCTWFSCPLLFLGVIVCSQFKNILYQRFELEGKYLTKAI